jgi:hypothetical protein
MAEDNPVKRVFEVRKQCSVENGFEILQFSGRTLKDCVGVHANIPISVSGTYMLCKVSCERVLDQDLIKRHKEGHDLCVTRFQPWLPYCNWKNRIDIDVVQKM